MEEIKRFGAFDIAQKFGLDVESEDFVFKPQETTLNRHSEPHRSEMYGVGLLLIGYAELKVGLENYALKAPGLVAINPDDIRQWVHKQDNLTVRSIFFSEKFVVEGLSDTLFLKKLDIFKRKSNHFIPLNSDALATVQTLFDQIEKKYISNSPSKRTIIQALLRTLLLETESLKQFQPTSDFDKYSQPCLLAEKFKELLLSNFKRQREVTYYAEKLFVTPKYLSQVLKKQTGKTASELIDEIVCLEAKVLLQTNELNASQIADYLNFANPSFFGKFFKRQTGMSPVEYRKSFSQYKPDI
ncbi:MAG: helix-turn-helix domain-containing protein [Paludibacter sp.]|nr:helix-turn-helix domain-containing protein [Paludibacter sp.]